ncbi:MAG: PilZ domain-containing protein [Treponema sp.]|jgi:hypothetical protein|nr:PilZ domain-containing protein [Treponema sp.]
MSVITSQKITTYYERYKTIDVTYSKEIIHVTGLVTQQIFLKSGSDFWPCVIYSSSFQGAKVAINVKSGLLEKLRQANNSVSLRFSFKKPDSETPVAFFVSARVAGYSPYGDSKDIALFNIVFTQRPPDDLIQIMGTMLDANMASAKRRDERVILTPEVIRKMNFLAKETAVFIQGVPRRCILRDISFSGAKLIMMGVAKFLVGREIGLRVDFDDPRESFILKGSFIRSEAVEGRKELIALAALFTEVPMGYKIRLNDYLGGLTARSEKTGAAAAGEAAASAEPAVSAAADSEAKAELSTEAVS